MKETVGIHDHQKSAYDFQCKLSGLYLEITSQCNAHCPYCYNRSGTDGSHMDSQMLYRLLDEAIEARVGNIAVSGGEPSLHPEFIPFLNACATAGVHTTVITNARFADDERCIEALRHSNVQITLDQVSGALNDAYRGTGSFRAIKKTFLALARSGHAGRRIMRVNIVKENQLFLETFISLAKQWCATDISFHFLQRSGRDETYGGHIDISETPVLAQSICDRLECFHTYRREEGLDIRLAGCYPSSGCPFLLDDTLKIDWVPRVTAEGKVYPCQSFSDDLFLMGDVTGSTISRIMCASPLREFVNMVNERRHNNPACSGCVWKYKCWKGCSARTYMKYNTIWHDSGDCDYWKDKYKRQIMETGVNVVEKSG